MIITDEAGFEAALEEAMAILDEPPEPGTATDRRFAELLEAIADYQPSVAEPPNPLRERLNDLTARLERLQNERAASKAKPGEAGRGAGRFLFPG
jgi:hypothetical protein